MKKIIYPNIKKKLNSCKLNLERLHESPDFDVFFHAHDWESGYESGHGYDGSREEYYMDQSIMLFYLKELLQKFKAKNCIVAPLGNYHYFETWSNIKKNDIYLELIKILNNLKIRIDSQSGIELDVEKEFTVIKRFVEGGFRYISRAMFFFPEIGLVIEPHHHMNYLIYNSGYFAIEGKIIETMNFPDIKYISG